MLLASDNQSSRKLFLTEEFSDTAPNSFARIRKALR
jgi:hypothetical protein